VYHSLLNEAWTTVFGFHNCNHHQDPRLFNLLLKVKINIAMVTNVNCNSTYIKDTCYIWESEKHEVLKLKITNTFSFHYFGWLKVSFRSEFQLLLLQNLGCNQTVIQITNNTQSSKIPNDIHSMSKQNHSMLQLKYQMNNENNINNHNTT
jgi:hypothetical protein